MTDFWLWAAFTAWSVFSVGLGILIGRVLWARDRQVPSQNEAKR